MKYFKKIIICICLVIIVCIIVFFFLHNRKNNFTIPENYMQKYESHMSHVDGADVDYYIYNNKIIADIKQYYPVGLYSYTYEHTIKLYNNLKIDESNVSDYYKYIQGKEGKIVLHEYK